MLSQTNYSLVFLLFLIITNAIPITDTTAIDVTIITAISPVSGALSFVTITLVCSSEIVISCGVVSIRYSSGASSSVYV